jgi:hypothetical protein
MELTLLFDTVSFGESLLTEQGTDLSSAVIVSH